MAAHRLPASEPATARAGAGDEDKGRRLAGSSSLFFFFFFFSVLFSGAGLRGLAPAHGTSPLGTARSPGRPGTGTWCAWRSRGRAAPAGHPWGSGGRAPGRSCPALRGLYAAILLWPAVDPGRAGRPAPACGSVVLLTCRPRRGRTCPLGASATPWGCCADRLRAADRLGIPVASGVLGSPGTPPCPPGRLAHWSGSAGGLSGRACCAARLRCRPAHLWSLRARPAVGAGPGGLRFPVRRRPSSSPPPRRCRGARPAGARARLSRPGRLASPRLRAPAPLPRPRLPRAAASPHFPSVTTAPLPLPLLAPRASTCPPARPVTSRGLSSYALPVGLRAFPPAPPRHRTWRRTLRAARAPPSPAPPPPPPPPPPCLATPRSVWALPSCHLSMAGRRGPTRREE